MITLYDLPQCILAEIYSFDGTFREIYGQAIQDLVVHRTWWASTGNCREEFRVGRNGVLHGAHTFYHKNGALLRETIYNKEGQEHGVRREYSWRKNGQLMSVSHFQNGGMHGPYRSYFTDTHEPECVFCEAFYRNGKKHGRFTTYHKPGEHGGGVREEWMYENGRRVRDTKPSTNRRRPSRPRRPPLPPLPPLLPPPPRQ